MMDVTSLYTNIYHVDEVDTCSRFPNHRKLFTLSKTLYESTYQSRVHLPMMDVTSLYTNIYHVDEVDTCSRWMSHRCTLISTMWMK